MDLGKDMGMRVRSGLVRHRRGCGVYVRNITEDTNKVSNDLDKSCHADEWHQIDELSQYLMGIDEVASYKNIYAARCIVAGIEETFLWLNRKSSK